ncbi:alpha-methylacyl-CoA racemase [Tamaricihabitans halophyticus]|uniref:Alpha-methylacyl-CoA racemase n=1 Tax=Tamaricihabitans halophyticus TaxID=1262583 RepID=A0A4R2QXS1_9PSEU|nr:CaiB/BaiF CoA-transferase family protein [Tamaricihabitans halophyticus]TCP55000.1 alpha-methylacyl-CoA racemase [Tamaricihabitans halophyticus]
MGPLAGLRIIEMAGLGPTPFAGMLLSDMGAEVIRLVRPNDTSIGAGSWNHLHRGRPALECDIGTGHGRELVCQLAERADALIEGFRPGVMERHLLGSEQLCARNPRLVYGRATGYGQDGPLSRRAGHDINYISIAGVLGSIARAGERPQFPLSLLGDFGGGGMLLAFGVLCGVLEAGRSGRGQVIDAAMVDGTALLSTVFHALRNAGMADDEPGTNSFDGGAHFYNVYATSDGAYIAVGAVEAPFYARLLEVLGLDPREFPQWDRARWPELTDRFAAAFRQKTRAAWEMILEPADACATAVYRIGEAPHHPHNVTRGTFVHVGHDLQPAPAPRFSRTVPELPEPAPEPGTDPGAALAGWGLTETDINTLTRASQPTEE